MITLLIIYNVAQDQSLLSDKLNSLVQKCEI